MRTTFHVAISLIRMVQQLSLCFCSVLHSVFRQSSAVGSIQFSGSHLQCAPFNFQAVISSALHSIFRHHQHASFAWGQPGPGPPLRRANCKRTTLVTQWRSNNAAGPYRPTWWRHVCDVSRPRRHSRQTIQAPRNTRWRCSGRREGSCWNCGAFSRPRSFGGRPVRPWTLLCRTPSLSWTMPLVVWRAWCRFVRKRSQCIK